MTRTKKHMQTGFDFKRLLVVRNMNCNKWHLQYDNGMSLPASLGAPTYFDSPEQTKAFAADNGLRVYEKPVYAF
jgi:hypothetical protein